MNESAVLQIDLLKPHVKATLDEVRRAGPEACRAALYEVKAKLPEDLQVAAESVAQSCAGLHTLAAVATQLSIDEAADGHLDAAIQYALDAFEYEQAAHAQGCDG
jgi:enoyl-CoA hydratase/carnithine racemase